MKLHNTRGLSQVVTSVLIILIVLAAVVIIWAFIRPTITQAGEQITTDCVTLDVQVLSCADNSDGTINATIKRNAGSGDLQGIRILLADGSSFDAAALNELESVTLINVTTTDPSEANVAPLYGDSLRVCNPQYAPTTCS